MAPVDIEVNCPTCRVKFSPPVATLRWHTPYPTTASAAPGGFYTFTCPTCGPARHTVTPIVERVLLRAQVTVTRYPAELTERGSYLPALTEDDLIAFGLALHPPACDRSNAA